MSHGNIKKPLVVVYYSLLVHSKLLLSTTEEFDGTTSSLIAGFFTELFHPDKYPIYLATTVCELDFALTEKIHLQSLSVCCDPQVT